MAKRKKNLRTEAEPAPELPDVEDRNEELGLRADVKEALEELSKDIRKGFEGTFERVNKQLDYWDIYNCKLGPNQAYNGNSQIFLPIVHDAVKARATRFTNQLFPQAGRYIEVITQDGRIPDAEMSLLEYYIRKAKLRTTVVPALVRNGDIEGQYNVFVSWEERKRHVVWRVQEKLATAPPDSEEDDDKVEDIKQETITEGRPHVEVLADSDVLILPETADGVEDALAQGGSVTIIRRWSKSKIKQMAKNGELIEDECASLLEAMKKVEDSQHRDKSKHVASAAGVKVTNGGALVYETYTVLLLDPGDEAEDREPQRRIVRAFLAGDRTVLSCKRNPNWSDKIGLFSVPVEKVQGSFKGNSLVGPCEQTQLYANDTINEAADSSMYSMMPIVMTDPARNPRVGSMVLSLAAVWECSPESTQFAKFPDIWKSGFEIVASCKAQIMQTLSVSPAAITQSATSKAKPSQADVAREQQVDILTTADACTVLEEGILTPVVQFMIELDHQYRKTRIMIPQFGELGLRAQMEWVPPIMMDKRFSYRWFGVEQARTQLQMQQQVAALGMVTSVPPQMYPGHKINLAPALTHMFTNIFGPRLGPLIFIDEAKQVTLEPQLENEWLQQGMQLFVDPMDNDPEHLKAHNELLEQTDDPDIQRNVQEHMQRHMVQQQMKQTAMLQQRMAAMMGQGAPQPGGPPGRPGAQPKGPRGKGQQHPGAAHRDQIGPASGAPPQLRMMGAEQ